VGSVFFAARISRIGHKYAIAEEMGLSNNCFSGKDPGKKGQAALPVVYQGHASFAVEEAACPLYS
jgi:hypothetical protein